MTGNPRHARLAKNMVNGKSLVSWLEANEPQYPADPIFFDHRLDCCPEHSPWGLEFQAACDDYERRMEALFGPEPVVRPGKLRYGFYPYERVHVNPHDYS